MTSVLDAVVLPPGWEFVPFGRLVERSREAGRPDLPPLSVFLDEGVVPRTTREDNFNRLGADMAKYLVVRPGDVVFNKLRTWQGGLGVSHHEGLVSPAYFVCRPTTRVEPRFLHYLLRSVPYLAELSRVSKFMPPSQFDILWDDLRIIPILAPAIEPQQQIANYLDTESTRIDSLISSKHRLIKLLEEYRNTLTLDACTGQMLDARESRQSSLHWAQETPSHWQEVPLRLVARVGSGHTPSRNHPEWWIDCTIPWITTGDVWQMRSDRIEYIRDTYEKASNAGIANSSAVIHPVETVVLSRTASPGYSAIMAIDMATSQDFVTWTCGPLLRPRFLLLCLRAMRNDLLDRLAMGSTHKTIYMPDIDGIRIPLPPTSEQDRIVEIAWSRLRVIDQAVSKLERQIMLLSERHQSLVTSIVTGEKPVPTIGMKDEP